MRRRYENDQQQQQQQQNVSLSRFVFALFLSIFENCSFLFSVFPLFGSFEFVEPKNPEFNKMKGAGGLNGHTQEW